MNKRHAHRGTLGEVIHNGRSFFAWKDGFRIGTHNTLEEAMESLILRERFKVEMRDDLVEVGISSVVKYRLLVGGIGMVYEGESESEARRQFRLCIAKSKTAESSSAGESVKLFRNFDVVRKYHPPDREMRFLKNLQNG